MAIIKHVAVNINYFNIAATLSAASRMANKLEDTSNIDSDASPEKHVILTKRLTKAPRRLVDEVEDCSVQQSDDDFNDKSPLKKKPIAMKAKRDTFGGSSGSG